MLEKQLKDYYGPRPQQLGGHMILKISHFKGNNESKQITFK